MSLLSRRLAWSKHTKASAADPAKIDLRVHLLSTFTIDPLAPYLGHALLDHFLPVVTVGGFDQIVPALLAPDDDLSHADVLVVWPRFEDLWNGEWPLLDGDNSGAHERLSEIVDLAARHVAASGQTLVFVLPGLPQAAPLGVGDAGNVFGVGASGYRSRESLRGQIAETTGALLLDAEEMIRTLGIAAFDNRRMAAATIPYTEDALAFAGDRIARLVSLSRRGARKIAVVDADNTLWGGVVGEEGADGVDLADQGPGVSYREFQKYLLALRRAGMLVAVSSKNNEADAFDAFKRREMELRQEHLAAWRIDWNAKSGNIEAMAEELNLGTASMVFIDDSPMERAEVSSALPEVAVLEMPEDPAGWWETIARSGLLDRLAPTSSDLGRAESYAVETQRRVVRSTVSPAEFLTGLELVVTVIDPGTNDIPRFAQLLAKTNQFTFGGERHPEATVASLLRSGSVGRLFAARDRFGDYGVIAALLLRPSEGQSDGTSSRELTIDSFVLSCRAMARGIEDAMLAEAQALGATAFVAFETAKNIPMRRWLASLGSETVGKPVRLGALASAPQWPQHLRRDEPDSPG
jgi:FkbH-like protein